MKPTRLFPATVLEICAGSTEMVHTEGAGPSSYQRISLNVLPNQCFPVSIS
jgi:hypothetical protein